MHMVHEDPHLRIDIHGVEHEAYISLRRSTDNKALIVASQTVHSHGNGGFYSALETQQYCDAAVSVQFLAEKGYPMLNWPDACVGTRPVGAPKGRFRWRARSGHFEFQWSLFEVGSRDEAATLPPGCPNGSVSIESPELCGAIAESLGYIDTLHTHAPPQPTEPGCVMGVE